MFDRFPFVLHVTRTVNRVLVDDGQPPIRFDHLERWHAVVARVEERHLKEAS